MVTLAIMHMNKNCYHPTLAQYINSTCTSPHTFTVHQQYMHIEPTLAQSIDIKETRSISTTVTGAPPPSQFVFPLPILYHALVQVHQSSAVSIHFCSSVSMQPNNHQSLANEGTYRSKQCLIGTSKCGNQVSSSCYLKR